MNGQVKRCSGYGPAGLEAHYTTTTNFHKNKRGRDGLHNQCKSCKSVSDRMRKPSRFLFDENYRKRKYIRQHKLRNASYDITVTRKLVWLYSLGICHLCLKPVAYEHVTMEHVVPLCEGGGWTWDNIRAAHAYCNGRKGRKSMDECEKHGILRGLRHPSNDRMYMRALTN